MRSYLLFFVGLLFTVLGCGPKPSDYALYLQHMPRSILVLPPLNESVEVAASEAFLSTVTMPLAECGYYVFPVAMVDAILKENGVPTAFEMHQVSLQKLSEVFGADAVMYIVINKWTTTYAVIDSSTIVSLAYRLIDTDTGEILWHRNQAVQVSSSQGQNNIIGMVVAASIRAAMSTSGKLEPEVARYANLEVFNLPSQGLLRGRMHPHHEKDQLIVKKRQEKLDRKKTQS
jgi:hypothetical protein